MVNSPLAISMGRSFQSVTKRTGVLSTSQLPAAAHVACPASNPSPPPPSGRSQMMALSCVLGVIAMVLLVSTTVSSKAGSPSLAAVAVKCGTSSSPATIATRKECLRRLLSPDTQEYDPIVVEESLTTTIDIRRGHRVVSLSADGKGGELDDEGDLVEVDPSFSLGDNQTASYYNSGRYPNHVAPLIHVHLHAIGDSITMGGHRNLLEVKMFRKLVRFTPYVPVVRRKLFGMKVTTKPKSVIASITQTSHTYAGEISSGILKKVDSLTSELLHNAATNDNIYPFDDAVGRLLTLPQSCTSDPLNISTCQSPKNAEATHIVVVCAIMVGTNDALFTTGSLIGDYYNPKYHRTLNVMLREVGSLHATCRNTYALGVSIMKKRWDAALELRNEAIAANATAARPFLKNGTFTPALLPPLPIFPKVTILNVPMVPPDIQLRNDSYVMANVLLPRRFRPDSWGLYGKLCLTSNASATAILQRESELHTAIDSRFVSTYLEKSRVPIPLPTSHVRLRVATKILHHDELLRRPTRSEEMTCGGLYSDCVHPSIAGYKILNQNIADHIAEEIRQVVG